MGIDAFIIKDDREGTGFVRSFLASPDFSADMLKKIGITIGIPKSAKRTHIVDGIASNWEDVSLQELILQTLINRRRNWVAIKLSNQFTIPQKCETPNNLIFSVGKEEWYGPIISDIKNHWFIKPIFAKHWIKDQAESPLQEGIVRLLIYSCVTWNERLRQYVISFHWSGFSHDDDESDYEQKNKQFEYWKHIPGLINNFQSVTSGKFDDIVLHKLVLHKLWDRYRQDPQYHWIDRRIRAEASGISLNARGILDIELSNDKKGLKSLSRAIWNSLEYEFKKHPTIELPKNHQFDEVVLGTMIRDLGALSYELELRDKVDESTKFRAHFYFGLKPDLSQPTRDTFPHIKLYIKDLSDTEQIQFLIDNIDNRDDENPKQMDLF